MSDQQKNGKIHILQYNKMRGIRNGSLEEAKWNKNRTQFSYENQIASQTNNDEYKMAVWNTKTGEIVKWVDVSMMNVKNIRQGEEGTGETTQISWNLQYKKKLAQ